MGSPEVERARQQLKEKEYARAVKDLKKNIRQSPDDKTLRFLLARAYVLLGRKKQSTAFIMHAEPHLREAIKFDPLREEYHDLLVEIKTHAGKLAELSSEYRRKMEEDPHPLYEKMLKKIAALSILSIPEPKKKGGGKHKGYYLIHYVIMPAVVAASSALWILNRYIPLRNLLTLAVILYVVFRISLRPSSKKYEKW